MKRNNLFTLALFCLIYLAGFTQNTYPMENNSITLPNGSQIQYEIGGSGSTTLLFLHGWCIHTGYWEQQLAHFAPKYRVVAMNLPGFGRSTATREEWTIENYSEDVTAFIDALDLKNVVLVGHSMSSEIALETAIHPNPRLVGIICVDNFKYVDVTWPEEDMQQMKAFFANLEANYAEMATGYAAQQLFTPETPEAVKNAVLKNIAEADPHISATSLIHLMQYSETEAEKLEKLPFTFYMINSDMPPTMEGGLKARCKNGYHLENVMGTGHYPMAEKPSEFNQQLEKVLTHMGR